MSTPHAFHPAPTATVVRTGQRGARKGLPLSILGTAIGALVLLGGIAVTAGLNGRPANPGGIVGILMGLLIGFISVTSLIAVWSARNSSVGVDQTGLWVNNGKAQNVIPWHTLAGVGLYWSKVGRHGVKVYSIELCPNGPIDRDAPVLWPLVRDEEPLHPALPRLRYRLPVPPGARDAVVAAIYGYVPQLWIGEAERAEGHIGTPDVKGHRARVNGRAA
jgi:hypothetical protein